MTENSFMKNGTNLWVFKLNIRTDQTRVANKAYNTRKAVERNECKHRAMNFFTYILQEYQRKSYIDTHSRVTDD